MSIFGFGIDARQQWGIQNFKLNTNIKTVCSTSLEWKTSDRFKIECKKSNFWILWLFYVWEKEHTCARWLFKNNIFSFFWVGVLFPGKPGIGSCRGCTIDRPRPHSSPAFLIQSRTVRKSLLNGVFSEQTFTPEIARSMKKVSRAQQFDHGKFSGWVSFQWKCFKKLQSGSPHRAFKFSSSFSVITQQPEKLRVILRLILL